MISQTPAKILTVLQKYCRDVTGAVQEIEPILNEFSQSYGSCQICYGRGFNLTGENYKYCECERATQLKGFVHEMSNMQE